MAKIFDELPGDESSVDDWGQALGADRVALSELPGNVLFRFQVTLTDLEVPHPVTGEIGHGAHAEAWIADGSINSQLEVLTNVRASINNMIEKLEGVGAVSQGGIERVPGSERMRPVDDLEFIGHAKEPFENHLSREDDDIFALKINGAGVVTVAMVQASQHLGEEIIRTAQAALTDTARIIEEGGQTASGDGAGNDS